MPENGKIVGGRFLTPFFVDTEAGKLFFKRFFSAGYTGIMLQKNHIKKITRREVVQQCALAVSVWAGLYPFNVFSTIRNMTDSKSFDAIIVGGSYAGLSAAMALGRSLRRVAIIDSGKPCNRYTPHSHNFITHDGAVPADIAAKAREQVLQYGTVQFYRGIATAGKKTSAGFEISTEAGETFVASRLVFATGVQDVLPSIEGFEECWGKTVIHCPYCHGYEYRGKKTAILANGDRALHVAGLVSNLTPDITIITQEKHGFSGEQMTKLKKHHIRVVEKEVAAMQHQNGELKNLVFKDGTGEKFDTVYAAIPSEQHCSIPEKLGCELNEQGLIRVDMFQKTTMDGIYACGDNASPMRSVANAVAAGNLAGAMVNNDLTMEQF